MRSRGRRRDEIAREIPEDTLRQIVRILGEGSAAAQALVDIERRREAGETSIVCYVVGDMYFVGPRIEEQ